MLMVPLMTAANCRPDGPACSVAVMCAEPEAMPLATRTSAPPEMFTSTPPAAPDSTVTTKSVACTGKSGLTRSFGDRLAVPRKPLASTVTCTALTTAPGTLIGTCRVPETPPEASTCKVPVEPRRAPASTAAESVPDSGWSPEPRKLPVVMRSGPTAWLTSICLEPSGRSRALVRRLDRSRPCWSRLIAQCDGVPPAAAVGAVARDGAGRRALADLQRRRLGAAPLVTRRGDAVGLALDGGAGRRQRARAGSRAAVLLGDVGQLVRQEALALLRRRVELALAEEDVAALREGVGAEALGLGGRGGVVVDAHVGERAAEARLESARIDEGSGLPVTPPRRAAAAARASRPSERRRPARACRALARTRAACASCSGPKSARSSLRAAPRSSSATNASASLWPCLMTSSTETEVDSQAASGERARLHARRAAERRVHRHRGARAGSRASDGAPSSGPEAAQIECASRSALAAGLAGTLARGGVALLRRVDGLVHQHRRAHPARATRTPGGRA